MIETIRFPGDVTLHVCRDTRFKQGCLSVQFLLPLCRQDAALNALVPSVLLRGSRSLPDLRAVTAALDELYGSSIGALARKFRTCYGTGFCLSFLEDRFALPGEQVLFPLLELTEDLLLRPAGSGSGFRPDYVESEKQNLISVIESRKNNKASYAMHRLIDRMCREDPSGTPRLGTAEQTAAITPEKAFSHYQRLLKTAPISLFYVGSMEPDALSRKLETLFSFPERTPVALPAPAPFRDPGGSRFSEVQNLAQSHLCMGFVTPVTLDHPLYPAMQLLNILYGSGMTSKLFLQVREARSLCYSIQSVYTAGNGILTVYAGIDADTRQQTEEEILHQLDLCCQGQITPEELDAARKSFRSSLASVMDSPSALEGYFTAALENGICLDSRQRIALVDRVTKEEIAQAARSLRLHTVYFLEGSHS